MTDYRIFETDEFKKSLKKVPPSHLDCIFTKLKDYVYPQLRQEPFWGTNIKKLRGYSPETWRYRIGSFRLFYVIDKEDKIVFILTIVARKNTYCKNEGVTPLSIKQKLRLGC